MMKWETYSQNFRKAATINDFSEDEISKCLNYAHNLFEKSLPVIFDQKHLSLLVGYKHSYLQRARYSPEHFYRTFTIQKKSGGERIISEPLPSLKEIQQWILREILEHCSVSKYAKAYVRNRSIKENARFHINQRVVLTLDIEDFFGSIGEEKIFTIFRSLGYSDSVAILLTNLCALNDSLPQGAPTSPALSNIIMNRIDERIGTFTRKQGIRYTRYSDDMTFSGDFEPGMIIRFVTTVLGENGLTLNPKKTRTRYQHQQQEVTGIVVNKGLSAPKKLRRHLRQSLYYLEKYGLSDHLNYTRNERANYIPHLLGLANFILFIDPHDTEVEKYREILKSYLPR